MLELGRSAAPFGKEGLYLWTTLLMILTALLAVLASTAQASMQDKVPRRSSLWQHGKLLLELLSQTLTLCGIAANGPPSRMLTEEAGWRSAHCILNLLCKVLRVVRGLIGQICDLLVARPAPWRGR